MLILWEKYDIITMYIHIGGVFMDKFEGEDLYSFDNSSNKLNDGETSFDLNSFSSRFASNSQDPNPKKRKSKTTKKQKTMKIILRVPLFLI